MRFFVCALAVSSLAFAPWAHAGDIAATPDDSGMASTPDGVTLTWREPGEAVQLGRKLAMGEAKLRASGFVATVLVSSVHGSHDTSAHFAVSEEQRDAVVAVLLKLNYFERLAHLYASLFKIEDLREVAAMYACPSIARLWQFHSATLAALLSLGTNTEVQLPELMSQPSQASDDNNAVPDRDSIAQLLAFWFPGRVASPYDLEMLVNGIRKRTTRHGIDEVMALSQTPVASLLSTAQAHPKFDAFNRKELESPRLRNALSSAVLQIP